MTNFANRGKSTEDDVKKWLDLRSDSDVGFAWGRFPDARSARRAIANQPSDLYVARKGYGHYYLEVKETTNERRLSKSKISQYGTLLKFHHAGTTTLVVVYISPLDRWTWLTADDLFLHDESPKSFPFTNPLYPNETELLSMLFGKIRNTLD